MDTTLITFLSNAGTAGIVVVLLAIGVLVPRWAYKKLEEENRLLREALDTERLRANDVTKSAGVTNQLIEAIVNLAVEQRKEKPAGHGERPALPRKDMS